MGGVARATRTDGSDRGRARRAPGAPRSRVGASPTIGRTPPGRRRERRGRRARGVRFAGRAARIPRIEGAPRAVPTNRRTPRTRRGAQSGTACRRRPPDPRAPHRGGTGIGGNASDSRGCPSWRQDRRCFSQTRTNSGSRAACARASRDFTVPREHPKTPATSSYERFSKYRNTTIVRSFGESL